MGLGFSLDHGSFVDAMRFTGGGEGSACDKARDEPRWTFFIVVVRRAEKHNSCICGNKKLVWLVGRKTTPAFASLALVLPAVEMEQQRTAFQSRLVFRAVEKPPSFILGQCSRCAVVSSAKRRRFWRIVEASARRLGATV